MPVKSFIVFPKPQGLNPLMETLLSTPGCSVFPSKNESVFVLVTDTNTDDEEKDLLALINELPLLDQLTMVAGFNENEI